MKTRGTTGSFVIFACLYGLLTSYNANAVTLIVQDPCSEQSWLHAEINDHLDSSVGTITVNALTDHNIPFAGNERGLNAIRHTVTGDDAMEIVSDTEMRAYGWCYAVNGVMPGDLADQVFPTSHDDVITWFFGYAHYQDGDWVSYCTPTYPNPPPYICS